MRRRPGIAGLQNAAAARDQYRLVGQNVAKIRTDLMKEQLATFRLQLEEFARKYKEDCHRDEDSGQQQASYEEALFCTLCHAEDLDLGMPSRTLPHS